MRARIVKADPGATYVATFDVDLAALEPMVATPGDPRNGVPLRALRDDQRRRREDRHRLRRLVHRRQEGRHGHVRVASSRARSTQGKRVADGVHLYIQFGSQDIRRYAEEKGYLEIFAKAGAELVDPSCGACIKAGPGVSDSPRTRSR